MNHRYRDTFMYRELFDTDLPSTPKKTIMRTALLITLLYGGFVLLWSVAFDWFIWNGDQLSWNMPALIDAMFTRKFQNWLLSECTFTVISSLFLYSILVKSLRRSKEDAIALERIAAKKDEAEYEAQLLARQFQSILDSTKEVYVLLDRHGNILAFNKQMQHLTRKIFQRDIQAGDSMRWYGDPEAEHDFLSHLAQAFQGEHIIVEREITALEKKIWVQVQYIPIRSLRATNSSASSTSFPSTHDDSSEEITSVAFMSLDITDVRQADRAMRAANLELKNIRSALYKSTRVSITDTHGIITFVNDNFLLGSQYSREELYGKTHSIIRSGYHDDAFYRTMWETIQRGIVWRGEVCNRAKDGSLYWCDMYISPIFDANGEISQYISIRSDITERKKLETSLRELNVSLEQRVEQRTKELTHTKQHLETMNHEKDTLMNIVSHDLRNPISSIMLTAELIPTMLDRMVDTHLIHKKVNTIFALTKRMNDIVTGLLDNNRLNTGIFTPVQEPLVIEDIVRATTEDYILHATNKNITLSLNIDTAVAIPQIIADPLLTRQVLDNLISNAVKYSPYHTTIRVTLDTTVTTLRVLVQDEGPGILPEDLPKIFTKFAHLTNKPTGGEESLGLGLSGAKIMMERMNGSLFCQSTVGQGSTFIAEFPLAKHLLHIPDPSFV